MKNRKRARTSIDKRNLLRRAESCERRAAEATDSKTRTQLLKAAVMWRDAAATIGRESEETKT